jgi:hypothetical protein
MGRPTTFTQKLGKRICELISDGASLRSIGEMPNMPSRRTTRTWLGRFPDFEADYERARRHRADNLVDEIIELSDSVKGSDSPAAVNAARLAVTSRQWLATRLLPEYSEKVTTEVTGPNGVPLIHEPDLGKTALGLLGAVHSILKARHPERPASARAELPPPAVRTLLSGFPEPAEPAPVKLAPQALDPAREFVGSHPILDRNGQKTHPVFDTASGRVLRFVNNRGEQG